MWTYKQCKTMLTHVFKPRWLVLILLSAGNREFRREREKEKFGEEEGETEKEGGGRNRERMGENEGEKEDRVRPSGTERGQREKDSWNSRAAG